MTTSPATATSASDGAFELRFRSLFHEGRAFSFACDALGHIDLDRLSSATLDRYLYVRALVGHEFAWPAVRAVEGVRGD